MSRTLNLCEHLLFQGRRFHALGVDHRALRTFGHLTDFRELPPDIAEDTQLCLAELMLKERKFAKARRHLTAALAHDPSNAQYHYLMACAHEEDRRGDRKQALSHYRQSVQLDPENSLYACDAGLFAIKHGNFREGLRWLHQAVELAPDDAEIVGDVVRGLQEQRHNDEARKIARAAMFRNNRDPRFLSLWNDLRFQELHQQQKLASKRRFVRRAIAEGRVFLPFEQLTVETPTGRKLVRQDGPSATPPPHLPRHARLSQRKHA